MDPKKKTYSSTRSWKSETMKREKKTGKRKEKKNVPQKIKAKRAKKFGRVPQQMISSAIAG